TSRRGGRASAPSLLALAAKNAIVVHLTFARGAINIPKPFDDSGVTGTPTLKMDGKPVTVAGSENPPMTVPEFDTAIATALKG
ncbi:DsbA family protein, partial [Streptomyces sp. NPDC059556]